jgi:4-hydroxybenzoate polyprenyltransferase
MVRLELPGPMVALPDMSAFRDNFIPLVVAMRLHNALGCALVFLAGRFPPNPDHMTVELLSAMAVGLLCVAAHLTNDLVDLPADRTNRPHRPLPEGRLSLAAVRNSLVITLVAGLGLGLILIPSWWPWWLFWAASGPGYSLWAKGRGWIAPLWTAGVITSCLVPGFLERGLSAVDVAVLCFMFWYLVFREIVKTLADFRGDCLAGYHPIGAGANSVYLKTFIFGIPLALVSGWYLLSSWETVQRELGMFFVVCIMGALALVWNRLQPVPHLAGTLLKVGAFSGLALLFIVAA